MRNASSGIIVGTTIALIFFLAGCPQGAGAGLALGQDDNLDAGTDADTSDADVSDADAGELSPDADEPSSGALCGNNGLDRCAPLLCDRTLGCVECSRNEDCPAAAPECLVGRCTGCRPRSAENAASDCKPGTACSVEDYECHPSCSGKDSCAASLTCDEATGECVGCIADTDCQSGVCSKSLRRCVDCVDDSTCPQQLPRCRVGVAKCVACVSNEDCGVVNAICDALTFTCRPGCSTDDQCPGQICDLPTAKCVDPPTAEVRDE